MAEENKAAPKGWRKHPLTVAVIGVVLSAVASGLATYFGLPQVRVEFQDRPVPVPVPVARADDFSFGNAAGWVDDPAAVAAAEAGAPVRAFAATPAGQVQDLPRAVYLWKYHQKLLGSLPPAKNQNPVGSCVAHGTNTAVERSLAAEIAARGGDASEFTHFAEEATYAGSRIEIGKGAIRPTWRDPSGDGSVGAWAMKFVTEYGMVPRQDYPGVADLARYDPQRCRAWGVHNGEGVPAALEAVARKFPVKGAARITNWADCKKALASGYAVAVCSNQGFDDPGPAGRSPPGTRDARGVCQARGSWAHCMCVDGYHTDEGGKEWAHVENSWGPTAHRGPVGWGDPSTAGFWADSAVVDRMLRTDSWAFSGVTGFPARRLPDDWFIAAPRRAVRPDALALNREVTLSW